MPKTGCSSVKATFRDGNEYDVSIRPLHKQVSDKYGREWLSPKQIKYHCFAFVRNPFDRIVSCYVHKFKKSNTDLRGWYFPFVYFNEEETFASFIKKVCKIPNTFADIHFQSQYSMLYARGRPLYHTLGKFESLSKDFEPIRKQFGLETLPHIHNMKKGDWRDFYTIELAEMVFRRYKRDVITFGYEDEYKKLLEYIKEKRV